MHSETKLPSPSSKMEKLETRIDNLMRQNHFLRQEIRKWEGRHSNLTETYENLHKTYDELRVQYEELKKLNLLFILDSTLKRIFP